MRDAQRGTYHPLLHRERELETKSICTALRKPVDPIPLEVSPVYMRTPKGASGVSGFLDRGSDTTLVRKGLIRRFDISEESKRLMLGMVSGIPTSNLQKST